MHCQQLCCSTLERHVAFDERVLGGTVARHDPLLSLGTDPDVSGRFWGGHEELGQSCGSQEESV